MKKKNIIFITTCLLIMFTLTGCFNLNKTAITTNDFISKSTKLNYETTNVISQYTMIYDYIKEATAAESKDGYQVEFFVLDDETNAINMFNLKQSTFNDYKNDAVTETSINSDNYSTYTLISSEYYMYLCRVDNTLLYVKVKDTYKNSVKKLIKELNY